MFAEADAGERVAGGGEVGAGGRGEEFADVEGNLVEGFFVGVDALADEVVLELDGRAAGVFLPGGGLDAVDEEDDLALDAGGLQGLVLAGGLVDDGLGGALPGAEAFAARASICDCGMSASAASSVR